MPIDRVYSTSAGSPAKGMLQHIKEETEPIRAANFEQDIKPFADHIAKSVLYAFAGIIAAVTYFFAAREYPQINPMKYIVYPACTLMLIYGLSKFLTQAYLLDDYLNRQWKTKTDIEDYGVGGGTVQKNTIWLTLDAHTQVALPEEPRPGAYAEFAKAYLDGKAVFSELGSRDKLGATHFGFSTANYNDFRDVFLKNNLAFWRNLDYPQQGVELTPRGKRQMAELAGVNTGTLEQLG